MNDNRANYTLIAMIAALTLFTSFSTNAGKMYKWIDAEGNVHYTGTPPPADQEVKEEKIDMVGATHQASVTRHGSYDYCGDMKLPGPVHDSENLLRNIQGQRENWAKRLESQEQALEQSLQQSLRSSSRYSSGKTNYGETIIKEIRELKCALAWERNIREELQHSKDNIKLEYDRAQARYDQAVEGAYDACGPQPRAGNTQDALERYDEWDRCMSRHKRTIDNAQRQLHGAERDYQYLR